MRKVENDHRPLSPHLTIYKPQNTSVLSIFHRLTGIGLLFPSAIMVVWVLAITIGPSTFELISVILHSLIGKVFLVISLWALVYHTLTGVRHLVWDMGYGLTIKWVNISGWIIVVGSFLGSGLIILWVSW